MIEFLVGLGIMVGIVLAVFGALGAIASLDMALASYPRTRRWIERIFITLFWLVTIPLTIFLLWWIGRDILHG